MYDFLCGKIIESQPGRVVLDVGGIGFSIITPDHTGQDIGSKGEEALLWTHLHFKEDNLNLYGFGSRRERSLFLLLNKVSGVGPKMAMQIISGIRPEELVRVMADEDWKRLTVIPGVGPKTARRLLIELKESLTDKELQFAPSGGAPKDTVLAQAYNALENLGFQSEQIRMAIKDLESSTGLENIIKTALAKLSA